MSRAAHARVLLDANLLALLVVGTVDPRRVTRHRRTSAYSRGDYQALVRFIGSDILLTPNVATEASNLLRYDDRDGRLSTALRLFCLAALEIYAPTAEVVGRAEYAWLGVADAALLAAARPGVMLLTADGALYDAAARAGCAVEHFDNLERP